MVRLKNRWIIVRVDEAKHMALSVDASKMKSLLPSKRDLFMLLSDGVTESFGITHSGALRESRVQLCDNVSRLILIKTPRSLAPKVRAVLTCMTSLSIGGQGNVPVTLSVVSVHGSLRTTKRSMITKLRTSYKERLQMIESTDDNHKNNISDREKRTMGQSLQNVLQELHAIDF